MRSVLSSSNARDHPARLKQLSSDKTIRVCKIGIRIGINVPNMDTLGRLDGAVAFDQFHFDNSIFLSNYITRNLETYKRAGALFVASKLNPASFLNEAE